MTPPTDRGRFRRVARRCLAIGRWIAEPEVLPHLDQKSTRRSPWNKTGWLTGRENLATFSQPPEARSRFWSWLIASERLPAATVDLEPSSGSLLRLIFTAEQPAVAPKPEPTKEASSDEP